MNNMQSRHLVEFLSHDEENCVQQVNKFWKEIPPSNIEDSQSLFVIRVVNRLTMPIVVSTDKECPALFEHPETEEGLDK